MASRLSKQTVAQAALTVALVAILCAVFLVRPQPLGESLEGLAHRAHRPFGSDDDEAGPRQESLEVLRTLPAYIDVSLSLGQLNAAREGLLKAVAASDVEATFFAAADYQRTLDRVRADLAKLEDFVDPKDLQRCLQDLFTLRTATDLTDPTIPESHLGILPRVSPLPPENLP